MTDDELRRLQQKAYGGGEELTPAEAERLQELQDAVRRAQWSEPDDETVQDEPGEDDAEETAPQSRAPLPRWRIALVAGAAVAALAAGIGIGVTTFRELGLPMTMKERAVRAELEARGDFDAGSVRFAGADHGATVWQATQQDGELSCVMLTDPQGEGADFYEGSARCARAEEDSATHSYYFGSYRTSAILLLGEDGVLATQQRTFLGGHDVVLMRLPDIDAALIGDGIVSPEKRAILEELRRDGFARIDTANIGNDGAVSLWYGWNGADYCLVAYRSADEQAMACANDEATIAAGGVLQVSSPVPGGNTRYIYDGTSEYRMASLVIERSETGYED